jgi:imidazolonepropionase-like amidohydrolase
MDFGAFGGVKTMDSENINSRSCFVTLLLLSIVLVLSACGNQASIAAVDAAPDQAATEAKPLPVITEAPLFITQEPQTVPDSEPVLDGEPVLALVNATLIDGLGGTPLEDAVVLVKGDRIKAAGSKADVSVPEGADIIDLEGGFLLPGFINAHVHLSYNLDTLKGWLEGGVTTVRDLGIAANPVKTPERWQELISLVTLSWEEPQYTRIVMGTPLITAPRGYGYAKVASPEEGRQLVHDMLEGGAMIIKVAIENELPLGKRYPIIDQDVLEAVVAAAHERGAPVSAHVSTLRHVEIAMQAGVNDLAHMPYDRLFTDEMLQQLVENDTYITPTLELWNAVGWGQITGQNLGLFYSAGGKVALGTDFGGYTTPFDLGMPITEILLMRRAGMSPMDIIISTTRNAAYVCGMLDEVGTVETGKLADMIVVSENPLEKLTALEDVKMIMKSGVVVR